ncbi:MAG TPA: rhodanese-like domain-containing protein [Steroidobacteraceae bacterium]|jgi:rhodanese-related sulfurtransferase|nr:rhodanese-like domain-containing protein [Steroidobacteraceae bacterium]
MTVPELAPLQVKRRLDAGEPLRLLDVREPWERAIAGLAGSINIPMGEIAARWRELDPDAQIVVVCKAGSRSRRVAQFLSAQGFGRVANLSGGIDAWTRDIDPGLASY